MVSTECSTCRVYPVQKVFLSDIPVRSYWLACHFAMQAKSETAIGNELSLDSNMLHSVGPVTTRRNSRSLAIQNASQAKSFRNRSVSNYNVLKGLNSIMFSSLHLESFLPFGSLPDNYSWKWAHKIRSISQKHNISLSTGLNSPWRDRLSAD